TSWNTTTASNGSHTLKAIARDAAGNRSTSSPVTVTVSNSTAQPPAKWVGYGYINVTNGTAYFGFKIKRAADGTLKGSVSFYDNVTGFTYYSNTLSSLTVNGNQAVVTGTGNKNMGGGPWSGPFNFTLTVTPGNNTSATFQLQVSDGTTEGSTTKPIRRGNINQNY